MVSIHGFPHGLVSRKTPDARRPSLWIVPCLVVGIVLAFSGFRMYCAGRKSTALILCSMHIRPYQELAEKMKAQLAGVQTTTLFLDRDSAAPVSIARLNPDMIFTVGQNALETALPLRGRSPLVFTMVLFPRVIGSDIPAGVAGVGMIPSPNRQLLILKNGFHMRRVRLFYNPKVTDFLAGRFSAGAPDGLEIEAVPVETDAALIASLRRGLSGADAILLIPDPSILTEQGLRALIRESYADDIPIVAFAPMYLDMGAAVSLSVSPGETARTAVSLALSMADGESRDGGALHYPRGCDIRISEKAVNKLALHVDTTALSKYGDVTWSE